MSNTVKNLSQRDANQTLQASFNDADSSLTTAGFLVGKVGREIQPAISTTTVTNDTITYSYLEDNVLLYKIRCIYTDGTRNNLISAKNVP